MNIILYHRCLYFFLVSQPTYKYIKQYVIKYLNYTLEYTIKD